MKKWNFKAKNNVQEISKKLDDSLGSVNGFVFNIEKADEDSVTFKVRKQGLYAFYLIFINKVIVNGKILKTNTKNEANIEISFSQYFLWKLLIFTHIFLGLGFLVTIVLKINSTGLMYLMGGIFLAAGIILWISIKKKFKNDIQEYKTLISGILES